MATRITFIRTNTLRSEPRLMKEVRVAEALHFECSFVLWNRDSVEETSPRARVFNVRAPFGQPLFALLLPLWFIFCYVSLFRTRPHIIHACDWEAVVPAWVYCLTHRKTRLIYDIWDALIGRFPIQNSFLRRFIIRLEKFFIIQANYVLVPDPERLTQLSLTSSHLTSKLAVIYNSEIISPELTPKVVRPRGELTLVYVGVMSRSIRGLEYILEAARMLPSCTFHLAGYGPDSNYFMDTFQQTHLPNLHWHGRLSHEDALALEQTADIIVSLLDPAYDNYRFATSTKVFQAFRFQKPVITTEETATGRLVTKTGWGLVIPYTQTALLAALENLIQGNYSFTLNPKAAEPYQWQTMAKRLKQIYRQIT